MSRLKKREKWLWSAKPVWSATSIIGTFLVATTTSLTGNASIGVLSIAILLAVALVFLLLQKDPTKGSTEAATVD